MYLDVMIPLSQNCKNIRRKMCPVSRCIYVRTTSATCLLSKSTSGNVTDLDSVASAFFVSSASFFVAPYRGVCIIDDDEANCELDMLTEIRGWASVES